MNWFYALNGQQLGPVSDSQLDTLLQSGAIDAKTLVWRDGMADWQPLAVVRPTASPAPPVVSTPGTTCVECGHAYAPTEMVVLNNCHVCATCKPKFLQRMIEGGAAPAHTSRIWRRDRQFVLAPNTPLPDRCIRCNGPTNGFKLKRDLSWHPPAYYFLILLSLLIYVIVALVVRKKAVLHIGLCEQHRAERRRVILICSLGALLGVALLIAAAVVGKGIPALFGVVFLLGAAIWSAIKAPVVSAAKIEKDLVWIKGAGEPFLATLPGWNNR